MNRPSSDEVFNEAVVAFDAANHAWGRYRHFVVPTAPQVLAISMAGVRAAFAEAAISVPEARAGEPGQLIQALIAARSALESYLVALPDAVPRAELDEALGDLEEAIELLTHVPE